MSEQLFTRYGTPAQATGASKGGKPVQAYRDKCHRCGGQGGAEQWKQTGWTCFRCGGAGWELAKVRPLYTAEQLAKLDGKAQAKREKAQAAHKAKTQAGQAELAAREPALVEYLVAHQEAGGFIQSLADQLQGRGTLTEKQIEAARAWIAREAEKARLKALEPAKVPSVHLGKVGERIAIEGLVYWAARFPSQFGMVSLVLIQTEAGAKVKAKGKWFAAKGDQVKIVAAVKAHGEHEGEAVTEVFRVKEQERWGVNLMRRPAAPSRA